MEVVESVNRVHPAAPTPRDGARAQTVIYATRNKPAATQGRKGGQTREIDVRGSGASSALTPVSSFDPTVRGSDSHAAHA